MTACVFCAIVAGTEPATVVRRWPDAIAIVPLNPVTDGHVLILPVAHIDRAGQSPFVAGYVAAIGLSYADQQRCDHHLILNQGPAASQTIRHLHWHYIPRRPGDGLILPWTGQAVA